MRIDQGGRSHLGKQHGGNSRLIRMGWRNKLRNISDRRFTEPIRRVRDSPRSGQLRQCNIAYELLRSIRDYRGQIQQVGFWRHGGGVRNEGGRSRNNAEGSPSLRHFSGRVQPRYCLANRSATELTCTSSARETRSVDIGLENFGRHRHTLKIPHTWPTAAKPTINSNGP